MRKHAQPPTMFDMPAGPEPEAPQESRPLNMADWSVLYLKGSMTLDDDESEEENAIWAAVDAETERKKQELAAKGVS